MNDVNGCYGFSHNNPVAEAYKILASIVNKKDGSREGMLVSIEQAMLFLEEALK